MEPITPENNTVEAVDAPPIKDMTFGSVQVATVVVVMGKEVVTAPPHMATAVVLANDPTAIVALCGPASDLASVQDAAVMAQAYRLRDALRELSVAARAFYAYTGDADEVDLKLKTAMQLADTVLHLADPQFVAVKQTASAEERLAAARADYDPSLNPSTHGILGQSVEIAALREGPQADEPQNTGRHEPQAGEPTLQ